MQMLLTLLVWMFDLGAGGLEVEDESVEAQLVVKRSLRVLPKNEERNHYEAVNRFHRGCVAPHAGPTLHRNRSFQRPMNPPSK